ncbi:MAG: BspA family leucine-rich repeat surface protein, partial [Clostridiales bacterium]|nr:BspA family leucine-rich repeat surface protein [Clostridiales bacterium]
MEVIRCARCMEKLADGVRICPHCGYDQQEESQPVNALRRNTILHGKYLVGNVIGQGGFGITYVGFDLALEMRVAIKEYFPTASAARSSSVSNQVQWDYAEAGSCADGIDRFVKEARRMARLDAVPSIVRVREVFQENGTAYIVMDYVEGVTLKKYLLDHGVLNWKQCLDLLGPVMDSLAVIHDKGFIHRDISPDNIMVQPDGTARLLDMGAAVDVKATLGQASTAVAKRNFSAPEQYLDSETLESCTDVYGMAATIYYCLTGRLVPEAMERLYGGMPLSFPPEFEIPEGAARALERGLKLKKAERIGDMREFKRQLEGSGNTAAVLPEAKTEPEHRSGAEAGAARTEKTAEAASTAETGNKPGTESAAQTTGKSAGKTGRLLVVAAAVVAVLAVVFALFRNSGDTNPSGVAVARESETAQEPGTLMSDTIEDYDYGTKYFVFGSQWKRSEITSITFLNNLNDEPESSWDVSEAQDGTVKAWVEDGEALYIASNGGVCLPEDCSFLFCDYKNASAIDLSGADTSGVINMGFMFRDCFELSDLDVSGFDTANVTDMGDMFFDCIGLTDLDVSGFDTSNVIDMSDMFGCNYMQFMSLTSLDVSGFDTSNVTDMGSMFDGCGSLTSLDVSGFDTSNVTNMGSMFYCCHSLASLDVSGFDMSNADTEDM